MRNGTDTWDATQNRSNCAATMREITWAEQHRETQPDDKTPRPTHVEYWLEEFRPGPCEEKWCGYRVQVMDGDDPEPVEEYRAGNNPHVSDGYVPIREGLDRRTMRQFAVRTAEETAARYGLTKHDCVKLGDEFDG